MAYKKGMISYSDLKSNGWIDILINDLLGPPDKLVPNKYNLTGPRVRLYNPKRVEAAEKSALFLNNRKRRQCATEYAEISDFFS